MYTPLHKIFNPESVAIVGASDTKGSVGHAITGNLIYSQFKGEVFLVNQRKKKILGHKTFPTLDDVGKVVDLVIIATPAKTVPGIVRQCGELGIKGIMIISAGFQEAGEEGVKMMDQIREYITTYDLKVIGPNCLGFLRPKLDLNASFAHKNAKPGRIAFISQSGALCTAILDWANVHNVGFSHFVSIGSMVDIGFHDLIDYFGQDQETSSIVIYMESLDSARKFLSAARAFSRTKPIIVLKSGISQEGAKAAMSHTGSLAGNDLVFDAAFKRAGIVRVNTINELFSCADALSKQPRPKGNRLAIITNAGGPGVISTDFLVKRGGELAELSADSIKNLNETLPPMWSHGNPVDVLGDASPERYKRAIEILMKDRNIDGVLTILTPQQMTDADNVAKILVKVPNPQRKTLLASFMGESEVEAARLTLGEGRIPEFATPEEAVSCFMFMYSYSRNLELLYETPATMPEEFTPKRLESQEMLDRIIGKGRTTLTEREAKELLSYYEIPVTEYRLATTEEEAGRIATKLGFPVVMKISSPDILHKTDVGGIYTNVNTREEAWKAFRNIMGSTKEKMPEARVEGVLVEKMASKKYELILGAKKDPIFGPTVVFGMGGVAVEVFKDTHIGLPPLNMALAERIIEETKISKLLRGYRNMKGVDIDSIKFLLYKFSYLLMDFPAIKEIDINPFAVDEAGGITLDAKVVLDPDVDPDARPYSHLVISPYPYEYITTFEMKNGKEVILRPIRPEDEPLEGEMFTKLSKESQRFRFFSLIKDITHEMLIRYTQIDYDREIAIIVETEEDGQKMMAGVVRLVADAYNETAEYAILIADQWQGLGLGNKLTDYILDIARERKIKNVYAEILNDNKIMLEMADKRGFVLKERFEDSVVMELNLVVANQPVLQ